METKKKSKIDEFIHEKFREREVKRVNRAKISGGLRRSLSGKIEDYARELQTTLFDGRALKDFIVYWTNVESENSE